MNGVSLTASWEVRNHLFLLLIWSRVSKGTSKQNPADGSEGYPLGADIHV